MVNSDSFPQSIHSDKRQLYLERELPGGTAEGSAPAIRPYGTGPYSSTNFLIFV